MSTKKPRAAKVMLLGDIGVGKTSLAKRLVFGRFDTQYKTTIGVDVFTYDVSLGAAFPEESLRLVLWDTDGDFSEAIFATHYIAGAAAALIVADATRPASFQRSDALIRQFEHKFPGRPVYAIVNKIDLVDRGTDMPMLADLRGEEIARTSALTGEGVQELFQSLALTLRRRS